MVEVLFYLDDKGLDPNNLFRWFRSDDGGIVRLNGGILSSGASWRVKLDRRGGDSGRVRGI